MSSVAGQTAICNYALVAVLGEPPIVSINDLNKAATTLKTLYDMVRQSELRGAIWKFAHRRALISSGTPPLSLLPNGIPPPYSYAYQVPNEALRVISFANTRQSLGMQNYRTGMEKFYEIGPGGWLMTSLGVGINFSGGSVLPPASQWIEYICDITDTTQFDPDFAIAFACALAKAGCKGITGKLDMFKTAAAEYSMAMAKAAMNNAIERLPEGYADDSYTLARL